jgi:hypothetical protein
MQPPELEQAITKAVNVTSQKVLIAKRFLMTEHHQSQLPDQLLQLFLRRMEAVLPKEVTINAEADLEGIAYDPHVGYFQGQGGSGYRSGWTFGQFRIWLPQQVRSSRVRDENQPLSNPDLYLTNLDIPGLHSDVEASLKEAVRCFRNELFLAAAVMVGRASEIGWSELAAALSARNMPGGKGLTDDSIATKIRAIVRLAESDQGKDLLKAAGVPLSEIRDASVWAHAVRDARNSVHHGVAASVENDYETVAVLLLSAVPNLRLVYMLMHAVQARASNTP